MKLLKNMFIYNEKDVIDSNYMVKFNWNLIILSEKKEEIL